MVSSRSPGASVTCSNNSTSADVPNNSDLVVNSSSAHEPVYNPRNDNESERDILNNGRAGWNSESGPPSLSMSIDLHHATSAQHDSGSFSASPDRSNATSCRVKVTESHEEEERYEGFGSVEGDCEEEVESPGGSSSAPSPTGPSSLRNTRSPNSTIGRHSWLRTSLRRTPSGTSRKRLSSNALASQLYRSSSFNSSGRGSICDTAEDMYSDVSLEDDVLDLNHRNPQSVVIGAQTLRIRKRDACQNCPAEFVCCNNGIIEPSPSREEGDLPRTSSPGSSMSHRNALDGSHRTQIKKVAAETSVTKPPNSQEDSSKSNKKSTGTLMTDDEKSAFLQIP